MTDINDLTIVRDTFEIAMAKAMEFTEEIGTVGYGVIELFDEHGRLKDCEAFANLITDAGDLYHAQMVIAGVGPAAPAAPTLMNGMKLGTGTTAVGKAQGLVTYLTASNVAFDATYPQTANLGAGLGVNSVYKTTWPAGTATNAAITEAAIVNDRATNATTTAANTLARIIFTAKDKGALDTLAITWNTKFLGV